MAVPPLEALVDAGHDVALVVTRVDKRRGRGGATSPSPVKAAAQHLGIPVSHDVDDVVAVGAELGVVVAYGRIIEPHVLIALPMVNLHFSLLPRWRGAAPVERALLAGDRVTGAGRKVTQNGDGIGLRAQTPILVAGTIDGDRLTLTFKERGARRPTEGKFVLLLDESGTLRGRFSSTAAQSSGTVEGRRLPR